MKQEDKELLLKDLCARLPYNVIVHIHDTNVVDYDNYLYEETLAKFKLHDITLKPYLRPMSSMTEEEYNELEVLAHGCDCVLRFYAWFPAKYDATFKTYNLEVIDWLNAHHFDYRGLIGKGLAIAVTKENNPYNIVGE